MTKPRRVPRARMRKRDITLVVDRRTCAAVLHHRPTGITVRCACYASAADNVLGARAALRDMLRHAARKTRSRKKAAGRHRKTRRERRRARAH